MSLNDVFFALSDPTRRQVLERIRLEPMPVGKIAEELPVSRPAVSQHLKVLKDAGLVSEEKQGTRNIYSVDPEGIAYKSGIRTGDIIYSLARVRIQNVNEFKDVLSDLDLEKNTTIGVARNGNKRILSLNLSK